MGCGFVSTRLKDERMESWSFFFFFSVAFFLSVFDFEKKKGKSFGHVGDSIRPEGSFRQRSDPLSSTDLGFFFFFFHKRPNCALKKKNP